jgi:hypothetical protein
MRPVVLSAAVLLLAATLSGCSLLSPPASAPSTNADAGGLVDPVNQRYPPLADVTIFSCKGTSGTWKVTGNVHNPTKTSYLYTISVELIDKSGNDVASIDAVPGPPIKGLGTGTWKASASGIPTAATACRLSAAYRN